MMMVTMEISTFHPQMEKITDAIGTGSTTDTSIITQRSKDLHLTTTPQVSSSNNCSNNITNYWLVVLIPVLLFLANFDLNLVMISDVFLASMPT